jgi:hypothetical protein
MQAPNQYKSPHKIATSAYDCQAQLLILNVLHFFKEVKKRPSLLSGKPSEVAARALNVNKSTFSRISKRLDAKNKIENPRKKIRRRPKKQFDSFDIDAIKNVIKGMYRDK